ncbi:uncharacterized protein LOC119483720 isoform X2 [Sebastes umbrosus]|uniref:uncharacterized protein LOC119483720 isoform X2 n=1 Tax=Sebastes umbrosus TaxID=72105 RepID=UPI00189FADF5|nr:uncharacterized protein LOC119483720 isoform X2 [Sebastes umbrosus]
MAKWKLCFVLLLMLTVCFADKVTLVKTIGREPDATPICSNATLSTIILIVCKIRPEKSGVECLLQYGHGRDFVHECDYRFTLMMENQTVFLHLTSLTPVDSGTYTCECSHRDGTDILHLNITVEDNQSHRAVFQTRSQKTSSRTASSYRETMGFIQLPECMSVTLTLIIQACLPQWPHIEGSC